MDKWIRQALKVSERGIHRQHQIGCVVVRGGKILSSAANQVFKHAEHRALRPHMDFTGATIYVSRRGRMMARPCPDCLSDIKKSGVTRIVYTDWNGNIVQERVR